MLQIHPNARATPLTRAETIGFRERSGVLAQRHGVSTETIRKWRKRGAADCLDHSARRHQLPWKATEEVSQPDNSVPAQASWPIPLDQA